MPDPRLVAVFDTYKSAVDGAHSQELAAANVFGPIQDSKESVMEATVVDQKTTKSNKCSTCGARTRKQAENTGKVVCQKCERGTRHAVAVGDETTIGTVTAVEQGEGEGFSETTIGGFADDHEVARAEDEGMTAVAPSTIIIAGGAPVLGILLTADYRFQLAATKKYIKRADAVAKLAAAGIAVPVKPTK